MRRYRLGFVALLLFAALLLLALAMPVRGAEPDSWAYVAPGAPVATLAASTTSTAATGLASASCYRLWCSAVVAWRTGPGTPVAVAATDAGLGAGVAERVCLRTGSTAIAVVTATGTGTCTVTALSSAP